MRTMDIIPPAVRVMDEWGRVKKITAPAEFTYESLKDRAMKRRRAIDRFGFMRSLPIHPTLAWPTRFTKARVTRMADDLNAILKRRGINYRFNTVQYRDAEDLCSQIKSGACDAVLIVLPESSAMSGRPNDTHEQVKKRLDIPSKCIHYDNTLPERFVGMPSEGLEGRDQRAARLIDATYRLTLDHLLIRHGWMPFEPAERFHFNVHIGLDVGGHRNDTVVACLGHGFAHPDTPLSFFMHQIAVPVGKAEPIPTLALYHGLLELIEHVRTEAAEQELDIDLDSVLFIRDGAMLGAGDAWHERDALRMLFQKLQNDEVVNDKARWAVAELQKRAEQWRLADETNGEIDNPLVGRCIYNFQRPNEGLLATTGRPYLTQGTAQVLKVSTTSIAGRCTFAEIVRDVAWEADLGLTRPDMGRSFPWVLHGADAGALHASRGYKLIGLNA